MVIKVGGGQGNQMFQYAMGRAISMKLGETLILDVSFFNKNERQFELDQYEVKYERKITQSRFLVDQILRVANIIGGLKYLNIVLHLYSERKMFAYEDITRLPDKKKKYIFYGYWQNTRYFEEIRDILIEDFTYKLPLDSIQMKYIEKMKRENSVAMHVRRTDYLVPGSYEYFAHLTKRYYDNAVAYIEKQTRQKAKIYIFSDDIEWCKREFVDYPNVVFVDDKISTDQHVDMELMRNCKHFVIANSTFSWWGAWLAEYKEKILVAPERWFQDELKNQQVRKALLCGWTMMKG